MKNIDIFNIGLIIVATIVYIILCTMTRYKSISYTDDEDIKTQPLTNNERYLLYVTLVFGFIYGTLVVSFHQRFMMNKIKSLGLWVFILFVCIILIFTAFYAQVYTGESVNKLTSKVSYAIIPVLPSLVLIAESAISSVLDFGFNTHETMSELRGGSETSDWSSIDLSD